MVVPDGYKHKYGAFKWAPWQNRVLGVWIERFLRLIVGTQQQQLEGNRRLLVYLVLEQYVRALVGAKTQFVQKLIVFLQVAGGGSRSPPSLEKRLEPGNIGRLVLFLLESPLAKRPSTDWLLSGRSPAVVQFLEELNKRFKLHLFEYTEPVCKWIKRQ